MIKRLAIACIVLYSCLFIKLAFAEPLRLSDADRDAAVGTEIYGILTQRCMYNSDCGDYSPDMMPPPRKPI